MDEKVAIQRCSCDKTFQDRGPREVLTSLFKGSILSNFQVREIPDFCASNDGKLTFNDVPDFWQDAQQSFLIEFLFEFWDMELIPMEKHDTDEKSLKSRWCFSVRWKRSSVSISAATNPEYRPSHAYLEMTDPVRIDASQGISPEEGAEIMIADGVPPQVSQNSLC